MADFRFKKFSVNQPNTAMKVNTDGVLLGAWMQISRHSDLSNGEVFKALDIGTGTGVIALMAAQRLFDSNFYPDKKIRIDALEIDAGAYEDAKRNFADSPWGLGQGVLLEVFLESVQNFNGGKYDLIFSNPPYFVNSLKADEESRSNARHTDTLSQADLIKHTLRLIKEGGRFSLILPLEEGMAFMEKINFVKRCALEQRGGVVGAEEIVFHISRTCRVKTTQKKIAKRILIELIAACADAEVHLESSELVITEGGEYTQEYKGLTGEFYL